MENSNTAIAETEKIISGVSCFKPEKGTQELNIIIEAKKGIEIVPAWKYIFEEIDRICKEFNCQSVKPLFMRFFFSDLVEQKKLLRREYSSFFTKENEACVSFIQQPPLSGSKLAVWIYLVKGEQETSYTKEGTCFKSNGLIHRYTANIQGNPFSTVYAQTRQIFLSYLSVLEKNNATLAANALRTWLFVKNIDANYQDVVRGRKEIFDEQGLNRQTHYIASTGIEGSTEKSMVSMDTYSVLGILPEQVRYLSATSHLCPTSKYGVTFERGTEINYGDRKHLLISGTASINNNGEIMHQRDVVKQTARVVENIKMLLLDGGVGLENLMHAIVYLRNRNDYTKVAHVLSELLPLSVPRIILLAPVCRPGWLVEIEGVAVQAQQNDTFPDF